MTFATFWIFACMFVATMADGDDTNFFDRALKGWGSEPDTSANTIRERYESVPSLDVNSTQVNEDSTGTIGDSQNGEGTIAVISDIITVEYLQLTARQNEAAVKLMFDNATLEGFSSCRIQEFRRINRHETYVIDQFRLYCAEVIFRAKLRVIRRVKTESFPQFERCWGSSEVTLTNLTVGGYLRTDVYNNGQNLRVVLQINPNATSSADFQPTVTGCRWNDYVVDFMKNQIGTLEGKEFKNYLIDRVEDEQYKHLNPQKKS